jgi:hypothetical protein
MAKIFEAAAPMCEALAIKRERLLAKRAAKEKDAAERASSSIRSTKRRLCRRASGWRDSSALVDW